MLELRKQIEAERDYLVALRREFHQHPELSFQEFWTASRIEEELDLIGIEHTRVGDTGVLGILRGEGNGDGVLVLRADIDALPIQETNLTEYTSQVPGVMHACGHDAHAACLLGAAKVLSRNKASFGGEVRLIFQHAEEVGQGAKPFISAGVLNGAARVFGLHTAPDIPSGMVGVKPGLNNASVDHFRIVVHGKSSHVSTPHLGVDALYIACQIVVAFQALVTRCTSPVEPLIIGVGKMTAGTTYNALADTAVLEGTTRASSHETRERIRASVTQIAHHIASDYGGTTEIEWKDFASPLLNNPEVCLEVADVLNELWGTGHVTTDRALSLAGDDFSEYLCKTPGVYAYLGTGNTTIPNTVNPAHNGFFDIDEDALTLGVALYAGYVIKNLGTESDGSGDSACS